MPKMIKQRTDFGMPGCTCRKPSGDFDAPTARIVRYDCPHHRHMWVASKQLRGDIHDIADRANMLRTLADALPTISALAVPLILEQLFGIQGAISNVRQRIEEGE
jgi:hypothetical protein